MRDATGKAEPGSLDDHVLIMGPLGAGKIVWARAQRDKIPFAEWGLREGDSEYLWRVAGIGAEWAGMKRTTAEGTWRPAPFRAPHHTVSIVGLRGAVHKGWRLRPGELSLAHGGILCLDEANEFPRAQLGMVADAIRHRSVLLPFREDDSTSSHVRIPAEFRLIATAAPCPCGLSGRASSAGQCRCTDQQVERYMTRLEPIKSLCRVVPQLEWQAEVKAFLAAGGGV